MKNLFQKLVLVAMFEKILTCLLNFSGADSSDLKFEMELFYDVRFEFVISRVVYLNERIYVRVRIIDAFQEDLDLLLLKCFSSTDPDGNNGNRTLIENR